MSEKRTVDFQYVFDEDYKPLYTNGAYGGFTPKGEVVINFFTEGWGIPNKETAEISESGELIGPVSTPDMPPINRTISTGVIMSRETAEQIHKWLGIILGKE